MKELSDAELEDDDSASADDEGKLLERNSSFLVDDFGGDFDYRRVFDEKNVETEYGRNKHEEFDRSSICILTCILVSSSRQLVRLYPNMSLIYVSYTCVLGWASCASGAEEEIRGGIRA